QPHSALLPYTTLFRSFNDAYRQAERTRGFRAEGYNMVVQDVAMGIAAGPIIGLAAGASGKMAAPLIGKGKGALGSLRNTDVPGRDRKSTRLNSSHVKI